MPASPSPSSPALRRPISGGLSCFRAAVAWGLLEGCCAERYDKKGVDLPSQRSGLMSFGTGQESSGLLGPRSSHLLRSLLPGRAQVQ